VIDGPTHPPPLTPEAHRARHHLLHLCLDELLADFLWHNRDRLKRPSNTTIEELLMWSHEQTINPDHDP
jgi:hypothetical protein